MSYKIVLDALYTRDIDGNKVAVAALQGSPGGVDKSLTRRVENLEAAAQGNLYRAETDSEAAAVKVVPGDAMPWATLDRFGGNVVSVDVRGVNLYNDPVGRTTAEGYAYAIGSTALPFTRNTSTSGSTNPIHLTPGTYALTFMAVALDGGSAPTYNNIYIYRNALRTKLRDAVGENLEAVVDGDIRITKALLTVTEDTDFCAYNSGCTSKKDLSRLDHDCKERQNAGLCAVPHGAARSAGSHSQSAGIRR